jgi:hypothetical protein
MPVFIVHGFRWDRVKIRHHVILNDVDDAASDYIMQSTTPDALRASFTKMFPEIMAVLPNVQFLEQYDPEDCSDDAHAQPYAYIADYIIKSDLSVDIAEVISKGPGGNTASWQAMADLSDKIAQGAPIRWYAVYNGDVERVGNQTLRPQDVGRASKVGYHCAISSNGVFD